MNRLITTATLALGAIVTSAFAQGRLDADTMKAFGGTYQVDCSNNASPKATVFPDALVFLHGDKRVAGERGSRVVGFRPMEHAAIEPHRRATRSRWIAKN